MCFFSPFHFYQNQVQKYLPLSLTSPLSGSLILVSEGSVIPEGIFPISSQKIPRRNIKIQHDHALTVLTTQGRLVDCPTQLIFYFFSREFMDDTRILVFGAKAGGV